MDLSPNSFLVPLFRSLSLHTCHGMHTPFSQVPRRSGFGIVEILLFYSVSLLSLHDDTGVGGNTGPELSSLLTDRAGDGGSLHLTLGVDDL